MPHFVQANANVIILISRDFHRVSNASREVCRKCPNLSYFLVRDFVVYDDTLLKTCAYAKFKCLANAKKIPKWGN